MKESLLITGTSKGIGNYIAQELSEDFEIFGISRTKIGKGKSTNEYSLDLTDFSQFDAFCEELDKKNIKLNHIILNAGVGAFGGFESIAPEKYKEIINLNLLSPILFLQKLLPFLEDKGKIIFLGSISSKKFLKYGAVYQASKFGLRGFAGALKNELGNGVHFINPKLVETNFHDDSQIKIDFSPEKITSLESISRTIIAILSGQEKRFEIDL